MTSKEEQQKIIEDEQLSNDIDSILNITDKKSKKNDELYNYTDIINYHMNISDDEEEKKDAHKYINQRKKKYVSIDEKMAILSKFRSKKFKDSITNQVNRNRNLNLKYLSSDLDRFERRDWWENDENIPANIINEHYMQYMK